MFKSITTHNRRRSVMATLSKLRGIAVELADLGRDEAMARNGQEACTLNATTAALLDAADHLESLSPSDLKTEGGM